MPTFAYGNKMSAISLIRIDHPQDREINLPSGEITIGRGSVLGCEDKRVSRGHASLRISDDGTVALVSLHTNPCFYKLQDMNSFAVLVKGQSKILGHGDIFSLLPNSFQYQVVIKAKSDLASESEVLSSTEGVPLNETNDENQNMKTVQLPTVSQVQDVTSNILENSTANSLCTPHLKTKRVLPGWLTNLPGSSKSTENPSINISGACKRAGIKITENEEELVKRVKEEITEEKNDDVNSTIIEDENTDSAKLVEPGTSNLHQSVDDAIKPNTSGKDGFETSYGDTSSTVPPGETNSGVRPDQSSDRVIVREPCIYGATCYRKNPHHVRIFSHPGDADFETYHTLPECSFGLLCYRKSSTHRKNYKHTQPPGLSPQSNADPSTTRTNPRHRPISKEEDDSEDGYDFDEPFINDASSDDYQPTSSSSEDGDAGEEEGDGEVLSQERNRMLREAKKFTKEKGK